MLAAPLFIRGKYAIISEKKKKKKIVGSQKNHSFFFSLKTHRDVSVSRFRSAANASSVIERTENITKSEIDTLLYRFLKLSNGLKILLISDSETDVCAGALAVGSGKFIHIYSLDGFR